MGAIIKMVVGAIFSAGFDFISTRIDKWNAARAAAKAAQDAKDLEEAQKNVTVLKAKEAVDVAVAHDPSVLRRDPDQRNPDNDKTG